MPRPRTPVRFKVRDAAPLFAALGDDTRLQLVVRLCQSGPQSIVRLTEGAKVTRQAISKHLRTLEGAGLVESSRNGREQVWEIRAQRLAQARHYLELVSNEWDAAIERLRRFVETDAS
jgi:DNA-binding transcriptional ArsR family regulator